MLGLARRANRLSLGHDAAVKSIRGGQAKACFLTMDSSERLKKEFKRTTAQYGEVPFKVLDCTMLDIKEATGLRSAVITVNDQGFASKLLEFLLEEEVH